MAHMTGRLVPSVAAEKARRLYPGLALCAVLAVAARFGAGQVAAPAILLALIGGLAFGAFGREEPFKAGMSFTTGFVLRVGIALLGVRIGVEQFQAVGPAISGLVLLAVPLTVLMTLALGRLLGQSVGPGLVAGSAVAVCGASAALAVAAALPRHLISEAHVAVVVIGVTALGTVSMLVYPFMGEWLGVAAVPLGLFLGAAIHDVAQAVGAGFMVSSAAGDAATITKLLRVSMLIPLVLVIAWVFRKDSAGHWQMPWFLFGFAAIAGLNSAGLIHESLRVTLESLSGWCLLIAMAGLGMKTSFTALLRIGWRPLAQLVGSSLLLAATVLVGLLLWQP